MKERPGPLSRWAARRTRIVGRRSPAGERVANYRPSLFVFRPSSSVLRRSSRIQTLRPQMARAYRLLKAASRLGVPGAIPGPPELLPAGARVLAQGYLNRFAMPLLGPLLGPGPGDWLLPRWMREQSDPACDWFVPRSVTNVMVNQTRRNWTALGIPGTGHSVESLVDRWGLLTPLPGWPSLDWWVQVDGVEGGWMASSEQREVLQSLQGGLPVVATSCEANGLRVSSEVWMLPLPEADWVAMQVVLFNIADLPLRGTFAFALRPYNPEGISPIYNIAFDGVTLLADRCPGPYTWPQPQHCVLSTLHGGDLFRRRTKDEGRTTTDDLNPQSAIRNPQLEGPQSIHDPHGFAHATLQYSFEIEPWEEAEFLAYIPVHRRHSVNGFTPKPLFTPLSSPQSDLPSVFRPSWPRDPQFYSYAKAATTLEWRSLLDEDMRLELPHRDLQASWEANRAHLLALHDGDTITPGPDLYHSFWFRDATYMTYALSTCGFR